MFRVHIEIDCALHLPADQIAPSTYVSFEAYPPNTWDSASIYTTNIIESNSNPQWSKQYEVMLPIDYLLDVRFPFWSFFFSAVE